MNIFKTRVALQKYLKKKSCLPLGFVPTMGALHKGHLELVKNSLQICSTTVVSIFLNPTQFNSPSSLKNYPVNKKNDIAILEKINPNMIVFTPKKEEIYPANYSQRLYKLGVLEQVMEGKFRHSHFQGVCAAVESLLHIVNPNKIFLGEKDFQQILVIQHLIDKILKIEVEIVVIPTVREKSGLAISSRNVNMTEKEKEMTSHIFQEIENIKQKLTLYSSDMLIKSAIKNLSRVGIKTEYLEIRDEKKLTLYTDDRTDLSTPARIFFAGYIGKIRLIDNIRIDSNFPPLTF